MFKGKSRGFFQVIPNALTNAQIQELLDYFQTTPTKRIVSLPKRKVEVVNLKFDQFPFVTQTLNNIFKTVLEEYTLEGPHFLTYYPLGGYHSLHSDMEGDSQNRIYTISLILNDGYEGGDLIIDGNIIPQSKGDAILFESNLPHEVTPITKGFRFSITECALTFGSPKG